MKWCINVGYFKSVSYGLGKIRLKGTFIEKRVNSDLIDMKAKEKACFDLHMLPVFISRDHLTRRSLNNLEYL